MAKQRDREEFVALLATERVPIHVARALMRASATLTRLAELECSSEAADRDRVRCPNDRLPGDRNGELGSCLCRGYGSWDGQAFVHGTVPRIAVQEDQTQARVVKLLAPYGIKPVFSGDPRGAVVKLRVPSGRTNDWGQTGICVP